MRLAGLSFLVLFVSAGLADEPDTDRVRFAAPKRIKAGDKFLGEGRYYPSPVLYDLDGDKRPEVLVGDLIGKVTFAQRTGQPPVALTAEKPLLDKDGKPLRFHNW